MKTSTLLLLLILAATSVRAQLKWTEVANPGVRISTIHFVNKDLGFFATGTVPGSGYVLTTLWRTTDGGANWSQLNVPKLSGNEGYGIQDILFVDSVNGYACGRGNGAHFWRTTNAGLSWSPSSTTNLDLPVVVRKTSAGIMVSDFYSQLYRSTDNGQSFSRVLNASGNYAGMDFVDDLHGVVNPHFRSGDGSWFYTTDGGITWKPASTRLEAWSIYGEKGTPRFYASPEGYSNVNYYQTQIYQSTNYGQSWKTIHTLPFRMNGHIDGFDSVLYVQTGSILCGGCDYKQQKGLYRSSDRGSTWKWIGGPDAENDTRFFIVPTCEGAVIYAGGIDEKLYKTVDTAFRSGTGSGIMTGMVRSNYKASDPIAAGTSITIPIAATVSTNAVGIIPTVMQYRIRFNPALIDTIAFNPSADITPPSGWSIVSASQAMNFITVILKNDQGKAITQSQDLGSMRFTTLTTGTAQSSPIFIDGMTLTTDCGSVKLNPDVEMSLITTVRLISASVASSHQNEFFKIHPNPASKAMTIQSRWLNEGRASVTIVGVRGEQVATFELMQRTDPEQTLDVSTLIPGAYTVILTSGTGETASEVLIIQ